MTAQVRWTGDEIFEGTSASGHSVIMDCSGKAEKGASPMELLLLSVGGCSAIDVVSILKKARQKVSDCVVEISAERRDEIPRIYTQITLHYKVSGSELSEKHVARAVQLSMEKYCSVSAMLGEAAQIEHSYEIVAA